MTTLDSIRSSYDNNDSLATMLHKVGTDEATLRLIHADLGIAMSTLRREADEIEAH